MSVWYLMARPAFVSPGSSVAPVLLFAFGLGVAAVSLWEATDRVVGTLGGLAIAAAALFIGGYDIAAVLLWPLFWAACASGKGCI